ncbi:MAG: GDSL-type esterase/lipase family protein [Patescibacteria group bacterium]
MKHHWFYPRLLGFALIAFLVVYALVASGRFLYFRQAGLELAAFPRQDEYTVGSGKPVHQVAVAGDSTAFGTGASAFTHTYHYQYLSQQPGTFQVQNVGAIGARVSDVTEQLNNISPVDLLFISISSNDVTHFTRLSDLSNQLDNMLTLAESKADTVILITPGSMGDVGLLPWPVRTILGYRSGQVSVLTKEVAKNHQVIQVDMFSHSEYSFARDPNINFAADLFHPSDTGYALWANAISKDVERAGGLRL